MKTTSKQKQAFYKKVKKKCPNVFRLLLEPNVPKNLRYSIVDGMEINKGWFPVVEELAKELETLSPHITCLQIKEKFATLCFYIDHEYLTKEESPTTCKKVYEIINNFTQKAMTVCEFCGKAGEIRQNGWWKILCDSCYLKREKEEKWRFHG